MEVVSNKATGIKDAMYVIEIDGSDEESSPTQISNVNIKLEGKSEWTDSFAPKVEPKCESGGESEEDNEFECKDNDICIGDFLEVNTHTDDSADVEDAEGSTSSDQQNYSSGDNLISVEITEVINGEVQRFRYKVRPVGNSLPSSSKPIFEGVAKNTPSEYSTTSSSKKEGSTPGKPKYSRRKQLFEQILEEGCTSSTKGSKANNVKAKRIPPKQKRNALGISKHKKIQPVECYPFNGLSSGENTDPLSIDPLTLPPSSIASQSADIVSCNNNNDDNNNIGDNGLSNNESESLQEVASNSSETQDFPASHDTDEAVVVPGSEGGDSQHSESGVLLLKKIKRINKCAPFKMKSLAQKDDSTSRPVYKRDKKIHTCNICSKAFTRKSSLNNHLNIHNPLREKPYSCNICGKSISNLSYLKTHQASHTNPWKCDMCGKNFKFKSYLSVHMRHHFNDRPYMCDLCGKAFTAATCLKKHIRIHTGISPYQCNICQKYFAQKVCLDIHMANHTGFKPYLCDMCGKSFPLSSYLLRHIRTEHETSSSPPEPKSRRRVRTLKKMVKCKYCKMSFKDRLLMKHHVRDYHDA